jgi:hypothetical protein
MATLKAVRGTRDLLPPETELWNRIETTARQVFARYNFGEIRTPIFEDTALFARSVGEETDIVSKEMYTWEDGERGKAVDAWRNRPHGDDVFFLRENLVFDGMLGPPIDLLAYWNAEQILELVCFARKATTFSINAMLRLDGSNAQIFRISQQVLESQGLESSPQQGPISSWMPRVQLLS